MRFYETLILLVVTVYSSLSPRLITSSYYLEYMLALERQVERQQHQLRQHQQQQQQLQQHQQQLETQEEKLIDENLELKRKVVHLHRTVKVQQRNYFYQFLLIFHIFPKCLTFSAIH